MSNNSRRHFLRSTAGISAAAFLHLTSTEQTRAQDQPADSEIALGLVTYQWGKEWDLATVIKNCEVTGFAGVELRSTHKHGVETQMSKAQRAEVKRRFADSPVKLAGLGSACEYHSTDGATVRKNIEETKAFIVLCHDVGGGGVKVRPNGLPKDVSVEKTLEQIGKALNEVAEFGEGYGVKIRLEVHGHGTAHIPHIRTIMDIADNKNTVVCWNCNRQDLEGPGLRHNFNLVRDRIGTVHIHDLRNNAYPWPELFGLLKGTKFKGWTLLEEGTVPTDIIGAMHENRAIWQSLVKPA